MLDNTPEKKAWLANVDQARDFAVAHGGDRMSPENRAEYESMLRTAADARSVHDVIEAAARVVARADGYGMSVAGRWLVVLGVTCTYIGALWLVLYDVSGGALPAKPLGDANVTLGVVVFTPGIAAWIVGVVLRRSGRRRAHR